MKLFRSRNMKHKANVPLEKFRIRGSKISNTENDLTMTGDDCVDCIHLFQNKDFLAAS